MTPGENVSIDTVIWFGSATLGKNNNNNNNNNNNKKGQFMIDNSG